MFAKSSDEQTEVEHFDPELLRLRELGARVVTGHDEARLLRDGGGRATPYGAPRGLGDDPGTGSVPVKTAAPKSVRLAEP